MGWTTLSLFGPDTTVPQGAASVVPVACTASGLRVVLEATLGVTLQFALQRGATIAGLADTALSCTVAAAGTSCTSGVATVALAVGDLVVFRSVSGGSFTSDTSVYFGWICQ